MRLQEKLLIGICILFTSSCGLNTYIPTQQSVTLFQEEGELQLSANTSVNNGGIPFLAQGSRVRGVSGAYSISDKFAAQINYTDSDYFMKDQFSLGLGYYNEIRPRWIFENYLGFAKANSTFNEDYKLSYTSLWAQPSFGFRSPNFECALSVKVSQLDYDYNPSIFNENSMQASDHYNGHLFYVMEPAFTIRGGHKYVKLQIQVVDSYELSNRDLQVTSPNIMLGIYSSIPLSKLKL